VDETGTMMAQAQPKEKLQIMRLALQKRRRMMGSRSQRILVVGAESEDAVTLAVVKGQIYLRQGVEVGEAVS